MGGVDAGSDDDVETECDDPCRGLELPRDVKISLELTYGGGDCAGEASGVECRG